MTTAQAGRFGLLFVLMGVEIMPFFERAFPRVGPLLLPYSPVHLVQTDRPCLS